MRFYISLSVFLSSAAALAASPGGFSLSGSLSSTTTADSSALIQGLAPAADQDIFVTVIKKDTNESIPNSFYGMGPAFSKKIYLPRGAGDYQVLVFGEAAGKVIPEVLAQFEVKNLDTRDLAFLLPSGSVQSDSDDILSLAKSITAGLSTDLERSKKIHDWVASGIRYDLTDERPAMDAVGTLKTQQAQCSGYATLTAALHRAIGIRAKIIEGRADSDGVAAAENDPPHVWNEVLIGSRWVTEDTTFDAGSVDTRTWKFIPQLSEDYFNPTPAFFGQTHVKTGEKPY